MSAVAQQIQMTQAYEVQKALSRKNLIDKGTEIVTLDDLLNTYYPWRTNPNYFEEDIQKADDPMLTSTTGIVNRVYGEMVWNQLNQEASIWGFMRKQAWNTSGMRFLAADSATGGGVAENAAWGEADQPDIVLGYSAPKTVIHPFQISLETQRLAMGGDDVLGNPKDFLRNYFATRHRSVMNGYLASEADTASGNNLETVDRMINATAVATAGLITAGDEDFENIDRSDNSWADSYVDHASGTDRDLTLQMIRDLNRGTRKYQEIPNSQKVYLTGEDTFERISSLYEGQNHFSQNAIKVKPSVNGVEVIREGQEAGFTVASLFNRPLIISKDIQVDTISRFYMIDLGYTHLDILAPTQYYEGGPSTGNPWALGKMVDEGLFVTMAQLRCSRFNCHGVIRDLQ